MTLLLLAQAGIPLTIGLRGQVQRLRSQRRGPGVRPDPGRRDQHRDRHLLLPPPDRHDVHDERPGGLRRQADAAAETAGRRAFALDPATALALGIAVAATVVMGVLPGYFLDLASRDRLFRRPGLSSDERD